MSSLFHGTPVKTLGRAIYDKEGLTFQKSLKKFWVDSGKVSRTKYDSFRNFLIERNQLNGSLYRAFSGINNSAGLIWSGNSLIREHSFEIGRPEPVTKPQLKVVGGRDVSDLNTAPVNATDEELEETWKQSKSA